MNKKYIIENIDKFINRYDNFNTQEAYLNDLKGFVRFMVKNHIPDFKIDYKIALMYNKFLKKKDYTKTTYTRKLIVVKKFYTFMRGLGEVNNNPFEALRIPTIDNSSNEKNIDDEIIKKLLILSTENIKYELIIYFLVFHGLRESEIAELKIDNLRLDDSIPQVVIEGKRDKKRIHPIRVDMVDLIKEYIKKEQCDEYLFIGKNGTEHISRVSIWRIVKKLGDRVGVKLHPHQFRHYAITKAVDSGLSIEQVKDYAGHVDINTTHRYYRLVQNLKNSPVLKISEKLGH